MTKKKLFLSFILALLLMPCAFFMSACGGEHKHNFDRKFLSDAEYHWPVCNGCDETKDKVPHTYDRTVAKPEYKNTDASCVEKATYFKTCICGAIGTETFEYGEVLGHDFSSTWSYNEGEHYHSCSRCNLSKDYDSHNGPDLRLTREATETESGLLSTSCLICGYEYSMETLPTNQWLSLLEQNWSPDTATTSMIFEHDNNGLTFDIFKHTYNPDGEYFSDNYEFGFNCNKSNNLPQSVFYLRHVTSPSSSIEGYSLYNSSNSDRYAITEEQFNEYLDQYFKLSSLLELKEDLYNKTNVISMYGEKAYFYDVYAIAEGESIIKVKFNYSFVEENGALSTHQKTITFENEIFKEYKETKNCESKVNEIRVGSNTISPLPNSSTEATDSYEVYISSPYEELDDIILSAFSLMPFSSQNNAELNFTNIKMAAQGAGITINAFNVYFDTFARRIDGEEDDILIPYSNVGQIFIKIDATKANAETIDLNVNLLGNVSVQTFEIFGEGLTYADFWYQVDLDWSIIPMDKYLIGFNTDINATEELANEYVLTEGTTLYAIFASIPKITIKNSIDNSVITVIIANDTECMYTDSETNKDYYAIDVYRLFDDSVYWLEGVYTSINCLENELVDFYSHDDMDYILMKETQIEIYLKLNVQYHFFIDGDEYIPTYKLNYEVENVSGYYDYILNQINSSNSDENITYSGLFEDKACTQQWNNFDLNRDIHLYTKKDYTVDNFVITFEQDLTENISSFVVYDLKQISNDFWDVYDYICYLFYNEGIYVYDFYTDAECTQEWVSWPTDDITIYIKIDKTVVLDDNYPVSWSMIEFYYSYELMKENGRNYRHLSIVDFFKMFVLDYIYTDEGLIGEGEMLEDIYLDAEFTQPFVSVPTRNITNLYGKIVPTIIISFDENTTEDDLDFGSIKYEPKFYNNFEYFKNYAMAMLSSVFELEEGQEIIEIYTDEEKTKPLTDYPTESCSLYLEISSIELITLGESENGWKLKEDAPSELPIRGLIIEEDIYNVEELIQFISCYCYEGVDGEEIDYIYYLNEENEEVRVTSLPKHAMKIYVAVKDSKFVYFDNSVCEPVVLQVSIKEFKNGFFPPFVRTIEDAIQLLIESFYNCDIDKEVIGIYTDAELTQELTEFPTDEVTLYIKTQDVPVIRFAQNDYCTSYKCLRLKDFENYSIYDINGLLQFTRNNCYIINDYYYTHEIVGLYSDAEFNNELTELPTEGCTIYIKVDRKDYGYYYPENDIENFVNKPIDLSKAWNHNDNIHLFSTSYGSWTILVKSSEADDVIIDLCDAGKVGNYVSIFENDYGYKPTHYAFKYTPKDYRTWEYIPGEDDWFEITYLEWVWGEELGEDETCTLEVNLIKNGVSTPVEVTPSEYSYTAPTCIEDGQIVFNATYTFEDSKDNSNYYSYYSSRAYTLPKTDDHDWYNLTYNWTNENTDHPTCVATATCRKSASHKLEETATIETTYPVAVTCTVDGKMKHTAEFTNPAFKEKTKEITLTQLGHQYTEQRAPEQGLAIPATCNAKAKYKYFCSHCGGEEFSNANLYEYGEPLTHQFGYINEGEHECSLCHIRTCHEFNEVTGQCKCGYDCPYTMGLEFTLQGDVVYYVSLGTVTANTVVIPNMYLGKYVTAIAAEGFKNATNITEITIGKNITQIGQDAFDGCTNLSIVNISSLVGYSKIIFNSPSSSPFYSSQAETQAFKVGETVLSTFEFGSSPIMSGVSPYAFYNYKGLTTLKTGTGMFGIGESAFEGCVNLGTIDMTTSMYGAGYFKTIGNKAFKGCTSLTTIVNMNAPDLTSIGESAFEGCSSLATGVTFKNTIKSIGKNAFKGCNSLTAVTFVNSTATWIVTNADNEEITEEIAVNNTTTNATNLTTTYLNYSWAFKEVE